MNKQDVLDRLELAKQFMVDLEKVNDAWSESTKSEEQNQYYRGRRDAFGTMIDYLDGMIRRIDEGPDDRNVLLRFNDYLKGLEL